MKITDSDILDLIEKRTEILVRKSEDIDISIKKWRQEIKNLTNTIKFHQQIKDELEVRVQELIALNDDIENNML